MVKDNVAGMVDVAALPVVSQDGLEVCPRHEDVLLQGPGLGRPRWEVGTKKPASSYFLGILRNV